MVQSHPTVFHFTHIKAGSQWVAEVLKHSAPERIALPQPELAHVLGSPIEPGKVYPAVYMSRPDAKQVMATTRHPHRAFVIIRDLRDTLISLYFSLKISHEVTSDYQRRLREELQGMDVASGLLWLIGREEDRPIIHRRLALPLEERYKPLPPQALKMPASTDMEILAVMQRSWLTADVLHLRYEDLVADEYPVFEQIIDYCEIKVPRARLHDIIKYNTFEAVTGRQPGEEDPSAHLRKGVAGDWQHYFTDRVKDRFKAMYGEVLIATGYEQDLNW